MTTVNIQQAKKSLSRLIERPSRGERDYYIPGH